MQRLHGRDANFLYQDTPTACMHTLKIHIIRSPDAKASYQEVRSRLSKFLRRVPMMRQRVVFVPFGLHHPVLVNDPDFDLDMHLHRAALPSPAGTRELEDMIAQIASGPLDRSRPLWEAWVLEGLPDNRIAIVQKIHHTLADGLASVGFITRSYAEEAATELDTWKPEPLPSAGRLILDALKDHLKDDIRQFFPFVKYLGGRIAAVVRHSKERFSPTVETVQRSLPRTRFNYALTNKRSFATLSLSLDEVKQLKTAMGGTLNDVVLAMAAGGLRRYLLDKDQLPDSPLAVSIPVGVDAHGAMREFGNNTANMMTLFDLGIADPRERFDAIRQATLAGKEEVEVVGRSTWGRLMHYVPPLLFTWIAQRNYRRQAANHPDFTPPSNLVVSNVPGPREPLGELQQLYSVGPLVEGIGLNITVWSYVDRLNFCLLGCKKAVPDIHQLRDNIEQAYRELRATAGIPEESNPTLRSA